MSEFSKISIESMIPDEYFVERGNVRASKSLLRLSGGLYVFYRRDFNTNSHPGTIDLIGGRVEGDETAYEVLARECAEEVGVAPLKHAIDYATPYPSEIEPGKLAWFAHSNLHIEQDDLVLGEEGLELVCMSIDDYLHLPNDKVFPYFQDRTRQWLSDVGEGRL